MKKNLLLILLFVLTSHATFAQLATWDFTGQNTGVATSSATFTNPGLAATPVLSRGATAAASSANNSFRTTGFGNNGVALINTDYFQFSLKPGSGKKFALTTINANFAGTASFYANTGVTSQFAYSLDGTTFTMIGSPTVSSSLSISIPLSAIGDLQNITENTTVTFRYFASGQTGTGGWGFNSSAPGVNGLAILGTVAIDQNSTNAALITNPLALAFGTISANTNSTAQNFVINGGSLPSGIDVNATAPFSISKDNTSFTNILNYSLADVAANPTVYVRFSPTSGAVSNSTVDITTTTASAASASVKVSGTGSMIDVTAPINTATFPKTANTAATAIDLLTNIDEAGTSYYVLIPATGTAPTTAAQIMAGTDGNGIAAFKSGSMANTANTNAVANITGLTALTNYNIYVVAKDAAGTPNVQSTFTTLSFTTTSISLPPANHLVISEVYGGGGNAGSVYKNDFIELYNPTDVDVALTGWSVQYTSATGTGNWISTALTGSIPARGFYLIQGSSGGSGISDLPTPDLTNLSIALSATAAKVILSNSTTILSGASPVLNVIDKIGIGASATGYETSPAPAYSATKSIERKASSTSTVSSLAAGGSEEFDGNGLDTDNNSTNFIVTTPNPQNSSIKEPVGAAHVVISEVFGGGGNSGALYINDFIELYNPTLVPVDLTGWSVQYASATGTGSWQVTPLSGTIAPKSFYLIQEAAGANGTLALPIPDKIGTLLMAGGAGKVLLANVTTAQTGVLPTGSAIVDLVGYGSTALGFEGTAPAPTPSATLSVERKANAAATAASMDVNGEDELNGNGHDSDDNSLDFVSRTANPQNSSSLEPQVKTGPYIVTSPKSLAFKNQAVNSTSAPKTYVISSGNVTDPLTVTTSAPFSISKDNVTYTTSLNYTVADLASNQFVYVKFNPTVLGNNAGSIAHVSTGATTTNITLSGPGVDPAQTSFNFENCVTVGSPALADGFYQYSVTGAQTWGCTTTFGHKAGDATNLASEGNALQMNGYASGNNPNEDWLISPELNLSSMTYAVLSYWTRSAFDGAKLQLKVSTNYSGIGNPNLATWTTIEGKFPEPNSDIWTKSDFIDLTAYKAQPVYVAFVYTSTSTAASRWTVDDFEVTNSSTAPPVDISVSTAGVAFNYQTAGSTSAEKSFTFSAGNLTGDVTLTAPTNFTISNSSNGTFGTALTYTQATTNNTIPVVYAKFSPTVTNTAYTGDVTISTPGAANKTVTLSGNSYERTNTLEVVNWNIEWFGSPAQAPNNDAQQAQNVKTVVNNINADIYGFAEVVDTTLFRNTVLPAGYNVIFSEYGSYANDKVDPAYPLTQKLAFMYRTDLIKPIQSYGVFRDVYYADSLANKFAGSPYKNWSSGRFPFLMEAQVLVNGAQETVYFIEIHAKANTGDVNAQNDSYDRRRAGNIQLKNWIDANLPNKKVIILGDFNDVLNSNKTIAPKPSGTPSSYIDFINDPARYVPVTLPLSLAGERSTAGFNTVIDNVIITNALNSNYISNTAEVMDEVASLVTSYTSTTTDHYPIQTRYYFPPAVLPIELSSFTATAMGSYVSLRWTTASETNNNYFTVERSTDGKNFVALKQVKGAGTSTSILNYNSIDENPVQGVNYYRIKQTDFDGNSTFSAPRAVSILSAKANVLSIYPNPASDKITLSLATAPTSANLIISGVDGRIIFNENGSIASLNEKLNAKLAGFTFGVYIVKLTADGQVYKSKFIKQ